MALAAPSKGHFMSAEPEPNDPTKGSTLSLFTLSVVLTVALFLAGYETNATWPGHKYLVCFVSIVIWIFGLGVIRIAQMAGDIRDLLKAQQSSKVDGRP